MNNIFFSADGRIFIPADLRSESDRGSWFSEEHCWNCTTRADSAAPSRSKGVLVACCCLMVGLLLAVMLIAF